jgi:phage shock protein PspC (stress-responsive transcriptional regulator)
LQLLRQSYPGRRESLRLLWEARSLAPKARQRLMRPQQGRTIAGVCLGFAEYFDLDVTIIRIVWLIVAIFGGTGFLAYVIAWIVMPSEPELAQAPLNAQQVPHS